MEIACLVIYKIIQKSLLPAIISKTDDSVFLQYDYFHFSITHMYFLFLSPDRCNLVKNDMFLLFLLPYLNLNGKFEFSLLHTACFF